MCNCYLPIPANFNNGPFNNVNAGHFLPTNLFQYVSGISQAVPSARTPSTSVLIKAVNKAPTGPASSEIIQAKSVPK